MFIEKEYQLPHLCLSTRQWVPTEINSEEPILLALHGWLDNSASFDLLVNALPTRSWYLVDMPGHGHSQHRAKGSFYNLWEQAFDILQLINDLRVSKINLIGHSMGGAVAMIISAIAPEIINKLVVLDSIGALTLETTERVSRLQGSFQSMSRLHIRTKIPEYQNQEEMIEARMNGFTKLNYLAAKKLVIRGSQLAEDKLHRWRHDPQLLLPTPFPMDTESAKAISQSISCPVLVLLAKEGIYKENEQMAMNKIKHISNVTTSWLNGGHHFHLENETADDVAQTINHFITNNE